jgi:cobalt-precorrin-5B (C1)-methyltransferase
MTHYTRSKIDTELLAAITAATGAPPAAVEEVAAANSARHAYEIWQREGVLDVAGADLCRRVAEVLVRFTEHRMRADVALVNFTGHELVASSGRWAA